MLTICPALERMSDRDLVAEVKRLAAREAFTTAQLVASLGELEARKLHLAAGCDSLFTYCTRVLGLSEGSAYRRIEAARLARRFPLVLERLAIGAIHLAALHLLAPHLAPENHKPLLDAARGKSRRAVEALVARMDPQPDAPSRVRKLPATRTVPPASGAPTRAASVRPAADETGDEGLGAGISKAPHASAVPHREENSALPALSDASVAPDASAVAGASTMSDAAAPYASAVPDASATPEGEDKPALRAPLWPERPQSADYDSAVQSCASAAERQSGVLPGAKNVQPGAVIEPAAFTPSGHSVRPADDGILHAIAAPAQLAAHVTSPAEHRVNEPPEIRAVASSAASRPAGRSLVMPLAPERYKVQMTVGAETHAKLRRVQDLLRHSVPNGDVGIIFDRALTLLLTELERRKLAAVRQPRTPAGDQRKATGDQPACRRPDARTHAATVAKVAAGAGSNAAASQVPVHSFDVGPAVTVAALKPLSSEQHTASTVSPARKVSAAPTVRAIAVTVSGAAAGEPKPAPLTEGHRSRHIPAHVKREVCARDQNRCTFVGPEGRCTRTGGLEFHHREPFAVGGPTTVDGLCLRCRPHNLYEAEQYFGAQCRRPARVALRTGAGTS